MKPTTRLLSCELDGESWFRPEGKGTFMSSPAVMEAAKRSMQAGASNIYIDLGGCLGMDSTFMGMLAGLAKALRKVGGSLFVVGASDKNRRSLEELGLAALMNISGDEVDGLQQARDCFSESQSDVGPGKEDHILECHENLCEADAKNEETFSSVLEVLRQKQG